MDLAGRAFDAIDWKWLERCRDEGVEESWRLDFKRENPLRSKEQKRDLAADICGFANASGGLLLLGVDEKKDDKGRKQRTIGELRGVDLAEGGFACYRTVIEDATRSAFDPRFGGILVREIPNGKEGVRNKSVVAIGIERSVRAPHMVTAYDCGKFFLRTMTSVEMMNADQVRDAILRSLEASTEAEARLAKARDAALSASQSYRPSDDAIVLLAALTPAFRGALGLPLGDPHVAAALSKHRESHRQLQGTQLGYDYRGAFLHPYRSFAAVDRVSADGTLERKDYVAPESVGIEGGTLGKPTSGVGIHRFGLARALQDVFAVFAALRADLEIGGSALLSVTLCGVKEHALGQVFTSTRGGGIRFEKPLRPIGVENLVSPTIQTSDEFFGQARKRVADFFWQAGGNRECLAFDGNGAETDCLTSWK